MYTRFSEEESRKVCHLLFISAAEGLLVVDAEGTIVMHNPRSAQIFGYEGGELLDRCIDILLPMALRTQHQIHRRGYMRSPSQRPMGIGMELQGLRKDGTEVPVEVSLNHFTLEDKPYVMALVSDISLRRAAERELQRLNMDLEVRVESRTAELREVAQEVRSALERERELNALKSRFVGMASHEFRTPLSTIMSSVDLIARYSEGPQRERVLKHVDRIRGKVRDLTGMLNEFLSLEKLDQGAVHPNPEAIDIVHLCFEIIEEHRDLAKAGQEVRYEHEGQERTVHHDRRMLTTMIGNLLGNAIKYSPEGRHIELSTTIAHGRLRVVVKDQGIGIPVEDQPHIMERFFRAHNAFTVQGTGLGLNITARFADLMGGRLSFQSTPGEGSTFTIDIQQHHGQEDHPADRG